MRFSIAIPVYNRETYVRQAIDSVLNQTFTDFELLVVDDGSTDGTAEVLKSYGSAIKVIRQSRRGPEVARNNALASAKGEYFVPLDSDDFLHPYALAVYDHLIQTFDSPPLIMGSEDEYQDGEKLTPDKLTLHPEKVEVFRYRDFLSKTITHSSFMSTVVARTSILQEIGGFRNSSPRTFYHDDLNITLRLGTLSPCIVVERPILVAYRQHQGNSYHDIPVAVESLLMLARSERQSEYPGGRRRRFGRYALIGGRTANWAYRYCWRKGYKGLGLKLLLATAPMVFAALWTLFLRRTRKPAAPIVLPLEYIANQPVALSRH